MSAATLHISWTLPPCDAASHLPTLAHHQVAAPVLLHWLGALGAWLCVGCQPIARLTVPIDLLVPHLPHLTGAGRVGRTRTLEAERDAAAALWLYIGVAVNLQREETQAD